VGGSFLAAVASEGWVARIGAIGSLLVITLTLLSGVLKLRIDWRDWTIWDFDPPPRRSGLAMIALACGLISVATFSGLLLASSAAMIIGEEALTEIRERRNVQGAAAAALGSVAGAMGFGMAYTALAYQVAPAIFDLRDLGFHHTTVPALVISVGTMAVPAIVVMAILVLKGVSRLRLISSESSRAVVFGRFVVGLLLGQVPAVVAILISLQLGISVNPMPFVGGS
jgi:hypothetical protein